MKSSLILAGFLLSSLLSIAQIDVPNGNFETWGLYNSWNFSPEHWSTSNFQLTEHVFIDSLSYEGTKAMMVKPFISLEPFPGRAFTNFEITEIPEVLEFVYKSELVADIDSVSVHVQVFNDNEMLYDVMWATDEDQPEWTAVTFPLPAISSPVTDMQITVQAGFGEYFNQGSYDTWISVDDMQLNSSTNIDDSELSEFEVIFKPDQIQWTHSGSPNTTGVIYDLTGQQLLNQTGNSIYTSELSHGIYVLAIKDEFGVVLLSRCFYR